MLHCLSGCLGIFFLLWPELVALASQESLRPTTCQACDHHMLLTASWNRGERAGKKEWASSHTVYQLIFGAKTSIHCLAYNANILSCGCRSHQGSGGCHMTCTTSAWYWDPCWGERKSMHQCNCRSTTKANRWQCLLFPVATCSSAQTTLNGTCQCNVPLMAILQADDYRIYMDRYGK